jgi:hypothetical protein
MSMGSNGSGSGGSSLLQKKRPYNVLIQGTNEEKDTQNPSKRFNMQKKLDFSSCSLK